MLLSALGAGRASAQVSIQPLGFAFSVYFEHDDVVTNAAGTATNISAGFRNVVIDTGNVTRAILYDLLGPDKWTNWEGAELLREVDLATGDEGIFVRVGTVQSNVSYMFTNEWGASYSNCFTAEATNAFPALTNAFAVANPFFHGSAVYTPSKTVINEPRSHTYFFASLNTTNLKFNFLATGFQTAQTVAARLGGTNYSRSIECGGGGGLGTIYFNGTANIFALTNQAPPVYYSGSAQGTISFAPGQFRRFSGP